MSKNSKLLVITLLKMNELLKSGWVLVCIYMNDVK
jgi:hypothetical protein